MADRKIRVLDLGGGGLRALRALADDAFREMVGGEGPRPELLVLDELLTGGPPPGLSAREVELVRELEGSHRRLHDELSASLDMSGSMTEELRQLENLKLDARIDSILREAGWKVPGTTVSLGHNAAKRARRAAKKAKRKGGKR